MKPDEKAPMPAPLSEREQQIASCLAQMLRRAIQRERRDAEPEATETRERAS